MRIAGIIAEYNPFHNGHAYHLQATKEFGADAVVAVMSGNFVQRGEPALLSKWERAKATVQGGIDLVVELPVYWSTATAQKFAQGGVSLLRHMGCVDTLSFGSECGDLALLQQAVNALSDEKVDAVLQMQLKSALCYAAARENAVRSVYGDAVADLLRTPNDVLGIEYLLACRKQNISFTNCVVQRKAVSHDSAEPCDGFAGASYIRSAVKLDKAYENFVPTTSYAILEKCLQSGFAPADLKHVERAILYGLRLEQPQSLSGLVDVSEGLENRIIHSAEVSNSLEELYGSIKTKRYSLSRIRRVILSYALGLYKKDVPEDVPYIRVLAIGKNGPDVLNAIKKSADIPILTKMTNLDSFSTDVHNTFKAELRASELYSLLLPTPQSYGTEWKTPIYVEK